MSRLEEVCVKTVTWDEDDDVVYAEGHQSYEIDGANDIAIFHGQQCVDVRPARDLAHAVSMVMAMESVCSYNLRNADMIRKTQRRTVDQWGCVVK